MDECEQEHSLTCFFDYDLPSCPLDISKSFGKRLLHCIVLSIYSMDRCDWYILLRNRQGGHRTSMPFTLDSSTGQSQLWDKPLYHCLTYTNPKFAIHCTGNWLASRRKETVVVCMAFCDILKSSKSSGWTCFGQCMCRVVGKYNIQRHRCIWSMTKLLKHDSEAQYIYKIRQSFKNVKNCNRGVKDVARLMQ